MKRLFSIVFTLFTVASVLFGQSKITLEDREALLTTETKEILGTKLTALSLELTQLVDFSNKCDYYFASIAQEGNELIIRIKNCDDETVGLKSVSNSILQATTDEQVIVYYYNLKSILENPMSSASSSAVESVTSNPPGVIETEHDSRYFFSPTAFNLKKGEFYYNTLYFFLHDIQVGLSDQLSIGFGSTIAGFPLLANAKASFSIGEKTQLAIGDLMMIGTYGSDFFGNLGYATLTQGSNHTNVSLSLGAFTSTENDFLGETFSLVYNLGGMAKASDYIYFVTENYYLGYNSIEYAYFYGQQDFVNTFEERFSVRDNIIFGMSGVRIVRKSNELASWQFGLAYALQIFGDYPDRYKEIGWDVYRETGSNLLAFPMFSYTKKFSLQ